MPRLPTTPAISSAQWESAPARLMKKNFLSPIAMLSRKPIADVGRRPDRSSDVTHRPSLTRLRRRLAGRNLSVARWPARVEREGPASPRTIPARMGSNRGAGLATRQGLALVASQGPADRSRILAYPNLDRDRAMTSLPERSGRGDRLPRSESLGRAAWALSGLASGWRRGSTRRSGESRDWHEDRPGLSNRTAPRPIPPP